jgi:hypothetical protein
LHGAIRYLDSAPAGAASYGSPAGAASGDSVLTGALEGRDQPGSACSPKEAWWDPGADASVSPETDEVLIAGVPVSHGSRVKMLPGIRRADAQDLFLVGRAATVQAVFHDVDGNAHVAVSPDEDALADLQRTHGRYLYFGVDELEPIGAGTHAGTELREDPA